MKHTDIVTDLALLVKSHYGIIVIETVEEDRAEKILVQLALRLEIPLFIWTINKGLYNIEKGNTIYGTENLAMALSHVTSTKLEALYHFRSLGPFLREITVSSKLIDIAEKLSREKGALILTGCDIEISESLKPHTAITDLPLPTREEYTTLLVNTYRDLTRRSKIDFEISPTDINRLINNLQGLTFLEAHKVLTMVMIEDGRLSMDDIQKVIEAKREIIEREGLLEYYTVEERFEDIADLVGLKSWLNKRKHFITDPDRAAQAGLSFPKGILLLGVPGTGKSLCAKAVSIEWGLPLLKMDPAKLYSKYIGETERNFKRAMEIAEKMSPLVLWVDEIEKAFATGGESDGGVSMRVLGGFLSWMQEREGDVFVVATANDVTRLPPELLRKGRFDEIFFVDLPDFDTRVSIFHIHLKRRKLEPNTFDLELLAGITDGFSGAEIEQVIVSALYTAFSDKSTLTTDHLVAEVNHTSPLSKVRSEHIAALREWAEERTVTAN